MERGKRANRLCGGMRKCRKIFKGGGKQKKSGIAEEMSRQEY